jgi:hypothetical protein
MGGPQVVVAETPPALGQAEREVHPAHSLGQLEQHQQSAGGEQAADVGERSPQVAGRVNDVRGQNHVPRPGGIALRGDVRLGVEQTVADEGMSAELLARPGCEQRRHVREVVLGLLLGQRRQDVGGRPSGSGAQLDDAQGRPAGQTRHRCCDRVADDPVVGREDR